MKLKAEKIKMPKKTTEVKSRPDPVKKEKVKANGQTMEFC